MERERVREKRPLGFPVQLEQSIGVFLCSFLRTEESFEMGFCHLKLSMC